MDKKRKKSSESDFYPPITPDFEDEFVDGLAILAHLIIGINPYLDISTVHIMLMENFVVELTEARAKKLGEGIAKKARISIPEDAPGGVH